MSQYVLLLSLPLLAATLQKKIQILHRLNLFIHFFQVPLLVDIEPSSGTLVLGTGSGV